MTSIYTKTGDTGETSLLGGKRVDKNCIEIDAIGEVDELNSCIGVLIEGISFPEIREKLSVVQHNLFTLGSLIAAVQTDLIKVPELNESAVVDIEQWIDSMTLELPALTQFILPGGVRSASYSFFARAVCRRAERRVVELAKKNLTVNPLVLQYLNRLSDLLFVLARWLNMKEGIDEVVWKKSSQT